MSAVLSPADLVWSAAFHSFGTIAFAIVALIVVVEAPLLRLLLRTPWDDTMGAVFLGHLSSLLTAIVLGVGFTDAMRSFRPGTLDGWNQIAELPASFVGVVFTASREVLAWPTGGTFALAAAIGFSCLTFVLGARSILQVPWTWRNACALLGVSMLTAITVGAAIWLRMRPEVPVETA